MPQSSSGPIMVVAAAVVERARLLVTQRMPGSHLAGLWELPGGKVEPDEQPRDALVREMREELGFDIVVGRPLEVVLHRYPTHSILLLVFESFRAHPSPDPVCVHVAALRWCTAQELGELSLAPADARCLPVLRSMLAIT